MQTDACATRQILEPNVLLKPTDVLAHIDEHGISHGLYGWWFDHFLPDVSRAGCLEFESKHLLYIGIAPPKDRLIKTGAATPVKTATVAQSSAWVGAQFHFATISCSTAQGPPWL